MPFTVVSAKTLISEAYKISRSEAQRVIEQGGVEIHGFMVKDPFTHIEVGEEGCVVKKGRHYIKVLFK